MQSCKPLEKGVESMNPDEDNRSNITDELRECCVYIKEEMAEDCIINEPSRGCVHIKEEPKEDCNKINNELTELCAYIKDEQTEDCNNINNELDFSDEVSSETLHCNSANVGDSLVNNWLNYMNCSRTKVKNNLITSEVYFQTKSDVQRDTELLTRCRDDYDAESALKFKDEIQSPEKSLPTKDVLHCRASLSCKRVDGALEGSSTNGLCDGPTSTCHPQSQENKLGVPQEHKSHQKSPCVKGTWDSPATRSSDVQGRGTLVETSGSDEPRLGGVGDGRDPVTRDQATTVGRRSEGGDGSEDKVGPRKKKPFECGDCGKRFGRKKSLERHIRTHTGEKPFECPHCVRRFNDSANLHRHVIIHTGERRHRCPECQKAFSQKSHLTAHVRNHTGDRPFGCPHCGKGFTKSGDLQRHVRTHTGERPFGCSVCPREFTYSGDLKRHRRTHTGERPFGCQECGQRFGVSSTLKKHLQTHLS